MSFRTLHNAEVAKSFEILWDIVESYGSTRVEHGTGIRITIVICSFVVHCQTRVPQDLTGCGILAESCGVQDSARSHRGFFDSEL